MISAECAETQIGRLDVTANFHLKAAAGIAELIEALRINAHDDLEAEAAVDLWLNHERECPTVVDVRASLQEVREGKPQPATSNAFSFAGGCSHCHGTGFVSVYQLCVGTIGDVLAQDLPGGYVEAEALRDRWAAERRAWNAANPEGRYKPARNEYIGTSAKKCGCGR